MLWHWSSSELSAGVSAGLRLSLCNILGFACWKMTCKNALERQRLEPDLFPAFPNPGMLRADVLTQITRDKQVSEKFNPVVMRSGGIRPLYDLFSVL